MTTKGQDKPGPWTPKERRRFFGFLREVFGLWLHWKFQLRFRNKEVLNGLKPPYLLLPNHVGFWDPFIAGLPIRHPIHFMVADSNYRSRILRWLLNYIEAIPKTKSRSDMESVKRMLAIRKAGGVICIFPEGRRTWDGRSLPLIQSTTKLIKLLKIPVITTVFDGMYFSHPCWAPSIRHGPVSVTYHRLFDGPELRHLSSDAIQDRLSQALAHDDHKSQAQAPSPYRSAHQAEFLERALHTCPSCYAVGQMYSKRSRFSCKNCGYSVHYTEFGSFQTDSDIGCFKSPAEWNDWQIAHHLDRISRIESDDFEQEVLTSWGLELAVGARSLPVEAAGFGSMRLYQDRMEFLCRRPRRALLRERGRFADTRFTRTDRGILFVFPLVHISGWNVQNKEHFEWYYDRQLFRIRDPLGRFSGYNWYSFVNILNGKHPQAAHLDASYFVRPENPARLVPCPPPAVE
ncbi:MAG: lysophospholipid acyltransferase family protein [Spirochaetota bacterium]